jgi:hypothetical protein
MVEAAQVAGFGKDGQRQDGTDAGQLLETPEVGVVLEVMCSSLFQLITQLEESDLGAWGLLLLESLGEALQSQIVVPHLGESFMLLVQAHEVNVLVADNSTAPLLDSEIVLAVVEGVKVRPSC